jgi:hypothetical protein
MQICKLLRRGFVHFTVISKSSRVSKVMCAIIKMIIAISFLYPAFSLVSFIFKVNNL